MGKNQYSLFKDRNIKIDFVSTSSVRDTFFDIFFLLKKTNLYQLKEPQIKDFTGEETKNNCEIFRHIAKKVFRNSLQPAQFKKELYVSQPVHNTTQ